MSVVKIAEEKFDEEALHSDIPVVVDFWAAWCGPCRSFAPTFEAAAERFSGKVKFCKVNVDECPGVSEILRIEMIPTLMMFKNGQPLYKHSGVIDDEAMDSFVNKVFE